MKIDLHGKRALVTGSTSGIGLGIARGLADSGAAVVVTGRDERRLAGVVLELRERCPGVEITGVAADLGTSEGVGRVIAAAPQVDILVNNVAAIGPRPFFETTDEEWERAFQVTVMSAVRLSRHELEHDWFSGPLPSLLRRFLTPEEVGSLVVFLASEQASGVTGAGLRVDGGIIRSLL